MATKAQLQQRWNVEPGKSIRERILAHIVPHTREALPDSAVIYSLLDGLPFRHEVPNGRDLRGSDCVGGRDLDFSDTDFSYSTNAGGFIKCDLSRCKFDDSRDERGQFSSCLLFDASFRKARFRSNSFVSSDARNACFDEALLYCARFDGADLREASFRGADLKGTCFSGAKLNGCDFRGANLQECSLYGVEVDENTDLRGANLVNAWIKDRFDNAGSLLGHALDLKAVKIDATTRLGSDPKLQALEILQAALEVSKDRRDTEAMRVRQAVQRVMTEIQKEYFDDWYDRVMSYLAPEELSAHDEIMDEAYRSQL
jgi:uncharacterized protein YjbI with pentapeptide repeats